MRRATLVEDMPDGLYARLAAFRAPFSTGSSARGFKSCTEHSIFPPFIHTPAPATLLIDEPVKA